ncbi:hypothetical protein CR513_21517, partial [Mucuna pruriens]
MYQGSKCVEEYFKEMEVKIINAQIVESQEATIVRFLHGLNRDIQDIMELHDYTFISILVEFQLRRHGNKSYPTMSSNWKGKERREEKLLRRNKSPKKSSAPFKGQREEVSKVNVLNSNTHKSSNIKCFKCLGKGHIVSQCLNKRTMILRDDDDIDRSKGYSSEEVSYEGDLLMENIFHLKCMVNEKCYSLIIDSGNSVNMASLRLMEKLCLPIIPHPKPYKLQWLSEKR